MGGPARGEAVQVDPMKFILKPPGPERLKLKCDDPLSHLASNFNLRRYSVDPAPRGSQPGAAADDEREETETGEQGDGGRRDVPAQAARDARAGCEARGRGGLQNSTQGLDRR